MQSNNLMLAGFLAAAIAVVAMLGVLASTIAPLPLERAIAREAVLDTLLARGEPAYAGLREQLADSAEAVKPGPDLPALKERSFCVRLGVDDQTDIPALFARARRMSPGRLVVGEIHKQEVREFFALLAKDPGVGGLATLRADSIGKAIDAIGSAFGGDQKRARESIARVAPAFAHMHSDEKGRPRLAAIWSVEGMVDGELSLREVDTGAPEASKLLAEA